MRRAAFRIFPRQTLSARARPPHTGAPHPQPAAMRRRISFGESVAICRGLLYTGWCCGAAGRARGAKAHTERYRSGHNGGASKALWEQSHVGSNPTLSAKAEGPCSAWALCFAFGQVGFEGRNRKCRSAAFSRPGENGQETAPRGAQAGRRPCGESHPLAMGFLWSPRPWPGVNPFLMNPARPAFFPALRRFRCSARARFGLDALAAVVL